MSTYYENTPMLLTEMFFSSKNKKFQRKNFDIFNIYIQNIDCGYMLEPPLQGSSNEHPQFMFWIKNKSVYPCIPQFY